MWATGFFLSLDGVKVLGMGVGYVITAVGPVLISALISVLYFREIRGARNLALFWAAIGVMVGAEVLHNCA